MPAPGDDTKEIEPLAIRRAEIVDADKVRYRVYRTPTDFVAVIAESALMAMKVAEIATPYRIVRDLPMSGIMIPSNRMEKNDPAMQKKVLRAVAVKPVETEVFVTTLKEPPPPAEQVFTPMQVGDFQLSTKKKISLMPPSMAMQALGEPVISSAPEPAEATPEPPTVELPVELPPTMEAEAPQPSSDVLSPEEVDQLLKS